MPLVALLLIGLLQTLTPPEAAATAEMARAQATAVSRFATASAPTRTAIPTMTPTSTQTPTPEPAATATQTPEPTLTATATTTPTAAPTETPAPTSTASPIPATDQVPASTPPAPVAVFEIPPSLQCAGLAGLVIVAILAAYFLLLPTVRGRR